MRATRTLQFRYGVPASAGVSVVAAALIAFLVFGPLSTVAAPEWRAVQPIGTGKVGFSQLPASETGIQFSNVLSDATVAKNQILLLGSGVALGDVDGDGLCDIYLCRLEGANALYRNLGNWTFADITAGASVGCPEQFSTGAALADIDGDSDIDLLVNSIGGGTRCFLNDGKGRFAENTRAGFTNRFAATSMALADVEGDGDLDVYVANYRSTTIRSTGLQVLNVNGRRVLRPEDRESYEFTRDGLILEHAELDFLYLNDGRGTFTAMSWTGGDFLDEDGKPLAAAHKDWGLSV
ncbi:MAG TPA: VCBS repeat-containing protein, partial [Verrucomicrobiae bacterium]|nr:VCBS repeat-containing protein [Verrucomicrobiae bacterium]